jgi:hypothetical protein
MSDTELTVRSAITTYFNSSYSTTAVSWPNKPFTEPVDGSAWVQFNIEPGNSLITTISKKNNEVLGLVLINIFTSRYSGTLESTILAQTIRALFNRKRISGTSILFDPPDMREIITPDDSVWFQRLVRAPFSYYEYIA